MGVFKEEMYVIETMARKQRQIYSDACDFGAYLSAADVAELREAVQSLRSCCHTRPVSRYSSDACETSNTVVYVAWELDGDYYNGSLVTIDTCKMKIGKSAGKTLFTINIQNKPCSKNSFEATKVLPQEGF